MTPSGEIRAIGRVADALRYGSRRQRRLAALCMGAVAAPLLGAFVFEAVHYLIRAVR